MLACTSSVMFSLAFFFLPALPLVPAKFAVCFSVGGACSIGAVGALRGAAAQISHMLAPDRGVVSLAYGGSALATLYASVVMHSYFLTIVASIAQTVALLYYQVSYFPMGAAGLKAVAQMGAHLAKPALYAGARWDSSNRNRTSRSEERGRRREYARVCERERERERESI